MRFKFKYLLFLSIIFVILFSFFKSTKVIGSTKYVDSIYTVKTSSNISYGSAVGYTGKTENLLLDIYEPVDSGTEKRPLIIFVHGGSFVSGTKTVYAENGANLAKKGYVVSSIDYRLDTTRANNPYNARSPDLSKPIGTSKEDTLMALNWFITNADKYRIDTDKIFLGGSSAGAVTALYTAFSEERDAKKIKAVYSIAGTVIDTDLDIIDELDPPTIMFNGTADGIVPYEMAQATIDKLKSKGVTAQLITYQGLGHEIIGQQSVDIHQKLTQFLLPYVNGSTQGQTPIPSPTLSSIIPTITEGLINQTPTPIITAPINITEDLNGDGVTDFFDIDVLIDGYFFSNMAADLNLDGIVNGFDYYQLYGKINH